MTDLPIDRDEQLWERWTIDELFDQIARVLVCQTAPLPTDETMIQTLRALADAPSTGTEEAARVLRAAVAEAETQGPSAWSDEQWSFIDARRLATFLERRTGKPGLPRGRPLREGDVFLVVVDRRRLNSIALSAAGQSVSQVGDVMAAYEAAGLEVFDVTAAARQSAKVLHDAAMRGTARRHENG